MPTAKPLLYRSNMPLSFAAILPHSPLLVPNIGKDNLSFFKQTLAGAEILAQHLEKAEVDMMLVISSHGTILQENFVCNIAPHFEADLSAFGDLVTRWEHTGSLSTPARMQQQVTRPLSIKLTSESLDYASAIALYLAKVPERIPVAALTVPPQPSETLFSAGKSIQEYIVNEEKRIGVIASADLSHRLNKKSPAGYSAKAKKLEQKILDHLVRGEHKDILNITPAAIEDAAIEDLGVIINFLGIIHGFKTEASLLSYESPFGIGHPVVHYQLS